MASVHVEINCHKEVTTDSKARLPRIREASRSRASDAPSPGAEVLRSAQAANADVRPGVSRLLARRTYRACVGKARMARLSKECIHVRLHALLIFV